MIDIIFNIEENKYKLTSDERQYILRQFRISENEKSKNYGEEVLSDAKYFRSIKNAFSYIRRTYPMCCDKVLSSPSDLDDAQRAVRRSSEEVMSTIEKITEEAE